MEVKISVLVITKNSQETLEKSLQSVVDWADEIVIIDDLSTDNTLKIVYQVSQVHKVFKVYKNSQIDLGKQRAFGLEKCSNEWILVLDSDEVISSQLKFEIQNLKFENSKNGYFIPFQTHYLGRKLKYGGENYKKLVLFRKDKTIIKPGLVNEKFEIPSKKVGILKNKIYHYSYRSIVQMYKKFTDYAIRNASEKLKKGEKTSIKKIFIYPVHMFWARFIKDKGYKDGFFRMPLDIGFAYMEFLTYFLLIFKKK